MRVLALDISTFTGFAVDRAEGSPLAGKPRVGTWKLSGLEEPQLGESLCQLSEYVDAMIQVEGVKAICIEAPMPIGGRPGQNQNFIAAGLIQLVGAARAEARRHGLEERLGHVQSVRKHFLGTGRPESPKRAVMARCAQLGWMVADHNQADAAALWCWAKSLLDPAWAPNGTSLFRQREAARA